MALRFTGSGQMLAQPIPIITQYPATFNCWFKPSATTGTQRLIVINDATIQNSFGMDLAGANLRCFGRQAGTPQIATSGVAIITGVWSMATAVFSSSTSRTIYCNGASPVTNVISCTPSAVNTTTVAGESNSGTLQDLLNGAIAFPAIWNEACNAAQVQALYAYALLWTNSGAT